MLKEFKFFDFLKNDIKRLEEYLEEFTYNLDGILRKAVKNTLLAGGKRIRPALFFISAKTENYNLDYLLPAAASIEIIHTASLIHDDIIDRSALRRGKETIHNIYDNDTAKFVGNFLFTHTFSILNEYKKPELLKEMSSAAEYLVRGEFDQLKKHKDLNQDQKYYFSMIGKKTSSLFRLSCLLGGILSGSSKEEIKKLGEFGRLLGIAFQINDDLLDIDIEGPLKIGKPIGNDIRQGNITLPIIYALKNKKAGDVLKNIIGKNNLKRAEVKKALQSIKDTNAIEIVKDKFIIYLNKAKEMADSIGEEERRKNLLKVCDYLSL